jgi:hypothetical protein
MGWNGMEIGEYIYGKLGEVLLYILVSWLDSYGELLCGLIK